MAKDTFRFKQFSVIQDRCAMKVGTDGVLLGAWAGNSPVNSVLDIGTGSGVIALMLAQRLNCDVVGLDIDQGAMEQARENFSNSKWADRLFAVQASFQEYGLQAHRKFDLIVSNPPYFSETIKSPDEQRSLARHSDNLSIEVLIANASRLLNHTGRIALVLPFDKRKQLVQSMMKNKLWLHRETIVLPTPDEEPNRILVEMGFKMLPDIKRTIIKIEEKTRHVYHSSFSSLTENYYL